MKNKTHTQAIMIEKNGLIRVDVVLLGKGYFHSRITQSILTYKEGLKYFHYSFVSEVAVVKNGNKKSLFPIYLADKK